MKQLLILTLCSTTALAQAPVKPSALAPPPQSVAYYVRSTSVIGQITGPHAGDVIRVEPRLPLTLALEGPGTLRVIWFQDYEPQRPLPQARVQAAVDGGVVRRLKPQALSLAGQRYTQGGPPTGMPAAPAPFDLDIPAGAHTVTLTIVGDDRFGGAVQLPGARRIISPASPVVVLLPPPAPPLVAAPFSAPPPVKEEDLPAVGGETLSPPVQPIAAPALPTPATEIVLVQAAAPPLARAMHLRSWGWAAVGVGALCALGGVAVGVKALSDNGGRINGSPDDHALARSEAHAADTMYVLGAAGLATGGYLLWRSP